MANYKIVSHGGSGLPLNVYGSGTITSRRNVCIWTDTGSTDQQWAIASLGSNQQVKSLNNLNYMLNANTSTWNCDVYTSNADTYINFILVSTGVYRLQLASDTTKYLTAEGTTSGSNVKWAALNNTTSQQWKITTVTTTTGDYITAGVGGWLKLYKKPTSSKTGRTVTIPTVASYTGTDGYTYKFTNKSYWYAYENPYKNKLNKYAIDRIKEVTGANPIVNVGSNGEYTDENGNYWMAVGPKVPNPSQASNANISAEQVYALGKRDVVVKSSNGTLYYIPGVIGDIKAHTWNNGVIQTYKAYPDGKFASAGRNFNGTVCAEFIGDLDGKLTGLGSYSVEKIIFYAD